MSKAKVSVIVPIYNVEPYFKKCIDSIRNQTMEEIEIILIDDGSPDRCPQMCDQFAAEDGRIKVLHQANAGVSAARNRGMKMATADWLMFVDPDDWLENDAIETLYLQTVKSDYDVICGTFYMEYPHKRKELTVEDGRDGEYSVKHDLIILLTGALASRKNNINLCSSCGKLYSRNIVENNQCRFLIDLKMWEDIIFNLYVVYCGRKIFFLNTPIYHYRVRTESATHTFLPTYRDAFRRYSREVHIFMEKYHLQKELQVSYRYTVIHGILSILLLRSIKVHSLKEFFEAAEYLKAFSEEPNYMAAISDSCIKDIPNIKDKIGCILLKLHMYQTIIMICFVYGKLFRKV